MTINREHQLEEAINLKEQKRFPEALLLCKELIPFFEKEEQWALWLEATDTTTNCLFQAGEVEQAINIAEAAVVKASTFKVEVGKQLVSLYSSLGTIYFTQGNFDKSPFYYQLALTTLLQLQNPQNDSFAGCYNNIGMVLLRKGNYDLALQHLKKAVAFFLKTSDSTFKLLNVYSNLGVAYGFKGDYNHALQYFRHALAISIEVYGEEDEINANIYNNIGICFEATKQYEQALVNYKKALNLRLAELGELHLNTAGSYLNLGRCYSIIGEYKEAIDHVNCAIHIYNQLLGEVNFYTAIAYEQLGTCYRHIKLDNEAILYYNKALGIDLQVHGEKHPDTAHVYYSIGNHFNNMGNYGEALQNYQHALQSLSLLVNRENYYELPNFEGCTNYQYLLDTLSSKANIFYKLYQQNQAPRDLIAALAHHQATDALIDHLRHSYKAEGSKLLLAGSGIGNVYKPAIEIAWAAYQQETQAGLQITQIARELGYQLPGETLNMAFHFSEKSKAMLYFSELKNDEAKAAALIPDELLQQVQQLRVELNYLDQLIAEEGSKNEAQQNKTRLSELRQKHFSYNLQYNELIGQLEKDYPDYYKHKYDTTIVSIPELQQSLDTQTAILEYFVGTDYVYIFCLTANNCTFFRNDISVLSQAVSYISTTDIPQLIEEFLECIAQQNDNLANYDLQRWFTDYAYALYQLLIAPVESQLQAENITQLIVIPDAYLYRLPFEALLYERVAQTTRNSYNHLPYLLLQYDSVQYHYSATLWHHSVQRNPYQQGNKTPHSYIGFAPVQYESDSFSTNGIARNIHKENAVQQTLPYTEAEVRGIGNLVGQQDINVDIYLTASATPGTLKRAIHGKAATFIHIAGHGYYNEQYPELSGLVLSPPEDMGNLPLANTNTQSTSQAGVSIGGIRAAVNMKEAMFYMSDTYSLNLRGTELVVLSCCDSGLGRFAPGEGMIAMNRGFLYAGAHNVIYTLFKVDDERSYKLVQELYVHILAGKTYSQALQAAKKAVLPILGAPYFWSGYVLIGRGR